jgi:CRP-like cAMP-binding protein
LLAKFIEVHYKRNEYLVKEKEEGKSFYIMVSGEICI